MVQQVHICCVFFARFNISFDFFCFFFWLFFEICTVLLGSFSNLKKFRLLVFLGSRLKTLLHVLFSSLGNRSLVFLGSCLKTLLHVPFSALGYRLLVFLGSCLKVCKFSKLAHFFKSARSNLACFGREKNPSRDEAVWRANFHNEFFWLTDKKIAFWGRT